MSEYDPDNDPGSRGWTDWALEAVAARPQDYDLRDQERKQLIALEIIEAAMLERGSKTIKINDLDPSLRRAGIEALGIGAYVGLNVHNYWADDADYAKAFNTAVTTARMIGAVTGHNEDFRTRKNIGKLEKDLVAGVAGMTGLATNQFVQSLDAFGRLKILQLIDSTNLFKDKLSCADGTSFEEAGYLEYAREALKNPKEYLAGVENVLLRIAPKSQEKLSKIGNQWDSLARQTLAGVTLGA